MKFTYQVLQIQENQGKGGGEGGGRKEEEEEREKSCFLVAFFFLLNYLNEFSVLREFAYEKSRCGKI